MRKGLLTAKCGVTGKVVNLRKAPCMKDYESCPIFRKAKGLEKSKTPTAINENSERLPKEGFTRAEVNINAKGEARGEVKKAGSEVEVPSNVTCEKCLYYSGITGLCVKMKVKVEDPSRPPCGRKLFKEA